MFRAAKAQHDGDPVSAWAHDRRRPGAGAGRTRRRAARAVSSARVGRGHRDRRRRARAHDQDVGPGPGRRLLPDPGDVDGLARRPARASLADRRADAVVLRLVRRPAGRLAAGVRRPDRRAGVGRLVGRRLPDHVGLQRPGDPHPGRALDDRGALPRAEGRRRRARLRRQREVRRRVAGRRARHRRRARDGHGPRGAQGVLRRPARRRTSPTTPSSSPTCRTWSRLEPTRGRRLPPRQVPHRGRPAGATRARTPRSRPCRHRRRHRRRPSSRNGSLGHRFGDEGVGRWNLDLGDIDPALSLYATAGGDREAVEVELPRFDAVDGTRRPCARGVPVRAGRRAAW